MSHHISKWATTSPNKLPHLQNETPHLHNTIQHCLLDKISNRKNVRHGRNILRGNQHRIHEFHAMSYFTRSFCLFDDFLKDSLSVGHLSPRTSVCAQAWLTVLQYCTWCSPSKRADANALLLLDWLHQLDIQHEQTDCPMFRSTCPWPIWLQTRTRRSWGPATWRASTTTLGKHFLRPLKSSVLEPPPPTPAPFLAAPAPTLAIVTKKIQQ